MLPETKDFNLKNYMTDSALLRTALAKYAGVLVWLTNKEASDEKDPEIGTVSVAR